MSNVLELCWDLPVESLSAGDVIMSQGEDRHRMAILKSGEVEIIKDGQSIATVGEPGAIFGELSVLLSKPHTATVRTTKPSEFFLVEDPEAFLWERAEFNLEILRVLAKRLDQITQYVADQKRQGDSHTLAVEMLGEAIDGFVHRQTHAD